MIEPIRYATRWNSDDFLGKSHLSHVDKLQTAPIPGTQILREQTNAKAKATDRQHFHDSILDSEAAWRRRVEIKKKLACIKAAVQVETTIGAPLEKVEAVLKEKVIQNNPATRVSYPDSKKLIEKFAKNIELGRHMYVGFATVSGFNSINYQDPITGTTFLHTACRKGYPEVVNELLKYKAVPDMKNALGNAPVHDCWMFWNNVAVGRPTSEREDQDERTCQMILKLMSFGAFVDIQDSRGQTPLHIACKMGPTKAVLILLGFKAKHTLLNKAGDSCLDLALKSGREDIIKVIESWDKIRREMKKGDFTLLWHKFLRDPEAVISNHKTVAEILSDFEMGERLKKIGRGEQTHIPIDDSILRQARKEKKHEVDELSPVKPWMAGWKEFAAGIEREKQRARDLQLERDREENDEDDAEAAAYNKRIQEENNAANKKKIDRALRTTTSKLDISGEISVEEDEEVDDNDEPDFWKTAAGRRKIASVTIQPKVARKPRQRVIEDVFKDISEQNRRAGQLSRQSDTPSEKMSKAHSRDGSAVGRSRPGTDPATPPPMDAPRRDAATAHIKSGPSSKGSRLMEAAEQAELADDGDDVLADEEVDPKAGMYSSQGFTVKADIRRRRNNISALFLVDAREAPNLQKKAWDSALLIPRHAALGSERSGTLGSVYDRVYVPKQLNLSETGGKQNIDASMDSYKVEPMPLVHGKRCRFVDADVLPPVQAQQSYLDKVSANRRKQEAIDLEEAVALGERAAIGGGRKDTSLAQELIQQSGSAFEKKMIEAAKARDAAMKRTFLRGQEMVYGKGRLTSTHNSYGHFDPPWEYTSSKFKPLPGVGY